MAVFNDRTGETNYNNQGCLMKIVEYNNSSNIVVEFQDEYKYRVKTSYSRFMEGCIRNKGFVKNKGCVGLENINYQGCLMKIIDCECLSNITVEFQDEGKHVAKTTFDAFNKGKVNNPNYYKLKRMGEENYNSYGELMKIIDYKSAKDVTIEFQDEYKGIVHSEYKSFKTGEVKNPNFRLGEMNYNNQGCLMKIVEYINNENVVIEFQDEYKSKVTAQYFSFKNGYVKNPSYNKLKIGEISINHKGTEMVIVEYHDTHDVIVEFQDDYKYKTHASYYDFVDGSVANPFDKTVFGVGCLGIGEYDSSNMAYSVWTGIIERCYNLSHPAYYDCCISDEWLNYQNFAKWYNNEYYYCRGECMHVDKDILCPGNRVYSADTCIIVPQRINCMITRVQIKEDGLPTGCHYHNDSIRVMFDNKYIGKFDKHDVKNAFMLYKKEKEKLIKQVADDYKCDIPDKVYKALYNYELTLY